MSFTPRLKIPEAGNPYYNTKSAGGYSQAIVGKCKDTGKSYPGLNVLANCVGYSVGRFAEIAGDTKMKYLSPVNAENFPEYAKGLKTGSEPKLGAVIVWQKGTTLKGTDGAGHVAIVEQIISKDEILISQSGYNSKPFWTEIVKRNNGTWLCSWMGSTYKFRCFIYNPAVADDSKPVLKKGSKDVSVKDLQEKLNTVGNYNLVVDGSFGDATDKAVKDFQKKNNLTVDGCVGDKTWEAINKAVKENQIPDGAKKLTLLLDGKQKDCAATVIGGENYIRLRDLVKLGLAKDVSYNSTKKMPEVKTK